ncbi:LOW QUALITY PROTEIN: NADPH oxidase 5-like [Amphiura filiformis]|uniref:LOW QUALITY PROTEIN: NADPH oxidase 5-like n=1 Tax=Amphiura filiformis TaxID=82378 RepID=UPI003B219EAF
MSRNKEGYTGHSACVKKEVSGNMGNDFKKNRNSKGTGSKRVPAMSEEDHKAWITWAERQFTRIAGKDRLIDKEEFKRAFNVKKSFFAERLFAYFDADGSGSITLDELKTGLRLLTQGAPIDKLKLLFTVYDVDGNGQIDRNELRTILKSCMEESTLQLSNDTLESLTTALIDVVDVDNDGTISFEELNNQLQDHPDVIENLSIGASSWMQPPGSEKKSNKKSSIPRYLTWKYIRNNLKKVLFLVSYLALNLILYVEAGLRFYNAGANWCIIVARGCGQCLNFNSAFVFVLMCRKSLSYLRATRAGEFLPIDQSITFHKMVGLVIGLFSLVHTGAHVGNGILVQYTPAVKNCSLWEIAFTDPTCTTLGIWFVAGSAFITGWALDLILVIMIICSMPFVRRSGHFQVFYWTHFMYVFYVILLLLHGPRYWKWIIAPGFIFALERLSQAIQSKRSQHGKTYVKQVNLLPSGVTHLVLTRPPRFHFKPGDYIFLKIPEIAKYEWHPFTISSPPEEQETIGLHIRSCGTWTNTLYQFFEEKTTTGQLDNMIYDKKNNTTANETKPPTPIPTRSGYVNIAIDEDDCSTSTVTTTGCMPTPAHERSQEPNCCSNNTNKLTPGRRRVYQNRRSSSVELAVRSIAVQTSFKIPKTTETTPLKIRAYIDGPYGTPTRQIFQAEHAVLIGAGIGVTPFAPILQSIMHRYNAYRQECPQCQHGWMAKIPESVMRLKKVDFIWINRHQKCFEWFVSLLAQLEVNQAKIPSDRFLEMHMFMTAARDKTDMMGIGLQMALDIMHAKGHRDAVTGLKTRTEPGRPDFNKLFGKFAEEGKGKVHVFFCGSPSLCRVVKSHCEIYKFKFHKENF